MTLGILIVQLITEQLITVQLVIGESINVYGTKNPMYCIEVTGGIPEEVQ